MPVQVYRDVVERPVLLDGRLKIRHLVYLDMIATAGSVVGAAERLHVTQPVVTRTLHEVEDILGVRLYDRGPRGLTPTTFGVAFLDHARAVLAQLRAASDHLAELAGGDTGTVGVGTYLAGSNLLLPMAIARLKAERPRITVVVREADPETLAAELLAGTLDLVVGRLTMLADGVRLRQEALYVEPVRLIARAGHPAATGVSRLTDLVDYPWVVPIAETALRRELEAAFLRDALPLPANRVECMSILTTRHLLLHTDAIAALPELVTRDEPGLQPLPVALPTLSSSVGVTTAAGRPPTPAAQSLTDQLREAARGLRTMP